MKSAMKRPFPGETYERRKVNRLSNSQSEQQHFQFQNKVSNNSLHHSHSNSQGILRTGSSSSQDDAFVPKPSLDQLIRVIPKGNLFEFYIPVRQLILRTNPIDLDYIQFSLDIETELIQFVKKLEQIVEIQSIVFLKNRAKDIIVLSEIQKNVWNKKDLKILINNNCTFVVDFENVMLKEGRSFLEKHKYKSGLRYLQESLRRYPCNDEVLIELIRVYQKIGDYEKVLDICNDYLDAGLPDNHQKVLFSKILAYLLLGCSLYNSSILVSRNDSLTLSNTDVKKCWYITIEELSSEMKESDIQFFQDKLAREYFVCWIILIKKALACVRQFKYEIPLVVSILLRFGLIFLSSHGRTVDICPFCFKFQHLDSTLIVTENLLKSKLQYYDKVSQRYKEFEISFQSFLESISREKRIIIQCCKDCNRDSLDSSD